MAGAVARFRERHAVFPIVVASEQVDNPAMRLVAEKLGGAATFSSTDHDMYQLVSVLRMSRIMVSSRYHAIVTTMPAGVASLGVTMDERITNLMRDRGHEEFLFTVDDPGLEERILEGMDKLYAQADKVGAEAARTAARHIRTLAGMGERVVTHISREYPEFAPERWPEDWREFLPALDDSLSQLIESSEVVAH
jgi:polysaccharide pyruvyl transferase WcaK-like protein